MNPALLRTAAILVAITAGGFLPQAHVLAPAVRWLIMAMLFIVFLQVRLTASSLHRSHAALLAANVGMAFLGWGLGWLLGGRELALAGFFTGIAPTATAVPVVMSFLKGRVDYTVAAFVLSNVVIAALTPFLLPVVLGRATPEAFAKVSGTVGLVVFAPMLAALAFRRIHPPATAWPGKLRNVSFGMWVSSIFLITSNASHFMRGQENLSHGVLVKLAGLSLVLCALNFTLGRVLGGRAFPREASQCLGQKNTSITIYLALTYASPLAALGPTGYVVWHNLWNSWQLHRAGRPGGKLTPPPSPPPTRPPPATPAP